MKKLQYTPAPWQVIGASKDNDYAIIDYAIIDKDKYIISEAFGIVDKNIKHNSLANARLIAAAPEMLEGEINSFKLLFDIFDNGIQEKHYKQIELLVNKKQKTIEKATGENIEDLI